MYVSNLSNETNFDYILNGSILSNCGHVRDLSIIVDKKLTFNIHIDSVIQSALNALAFIVRSTSLFRNIGSLVPLFNSLVKSKLFYGLILWHPYYNIHIKRHENVQRRFLKYLSF